MAPQGDFIEQSGVDLPIYDAELNRQISPNDSMFVGDDRKHYFAVGRSALRCLYSSLCVARKPVSTVKRILDLPCGHGRVLRFLRVAFPNAEVAACDLLRDGVDFCASSFGATPVYSHENPAQIPLERDAFDLIWVGSLFTHLPADFWTAFFDTFRKTLRPLGVVVFSTHGRCAYQGMVNGSLKYGLSPRQQIAILDQYERTAFGYVDYEGVDHYGISLSDPAWVAAQIARISEMRLVHFCERSWDDHHDIYACVRSSD